MNLVSVLILLVVLLVVAGLPFTLRTRTIHISSAKVKRPIRLVVLSDLHDCHYGKNMEKLLKQAHATQPDLVLMPGDMSEIGHKQKNMMALMKGLEAYPCFYSTGNHEEHDDDPEFILKLVRSTGVHVLDDRSEVVHVKDATLEIAGLRACDKEEEVSIETVQSMFQTDHFRILLSHRPHWVKVYEQSGADLVVCGHAHGGQWRIPFINKGIIAPGQGLFPKYTKGLYKEGAVQIAVSTGLVRTSRGIARLYNDPEILILQLLPESKPSVSVHG